MTEDEVEKVPPTIVETLVEAEANPEAAKTKPPSSTKAS